MRKRFPNLSQRLYLRPDVHIVEEDGRSFVRRSTEKYQVLQATLVDTWAATAAGAFALSENNLYTTDAFRDYLTHLTDDGVLAISRWGFEPPRESLRLISLAIEALGQLGEGEAWRHVIVAREGSVQGWGALDTVLISRQPFTAADIDRAREACTHGGLQPVYYPGLQIQNQFHDLLLSPNPERYQRGYTFDISPVSDNRPFFFYTVQPRIFEIHEERGAGHRRLQGQPGGAAAVRADGDQPGCDYRDPGGAAAGVRRASAAAEGCARVSAVLSVHRRRLHHD
jgi:hypothetical protein